MDEIRNEDRRPTRSPASPFRRLWWGLKRGVKELLLWSLYWSGAPFAHTAFFAAKKTVILCYHTASDEPTPAYPNNVMRATEFRRQMSYLKRHRSVVPLEECIARLREGRGRGAGSVALTFDDGYKSCLETVVPILKDHGFPATFFVMPGCMDDGKGKWDDVLYFSMGSFRKSLLRARRKEVAALKRDLEEAARNGWEKASAEALLSWEDLKTLRGLGYSVQSHSMHHLYLSAQPSADQQYEIDESKRRLEEVLGEPIQFLAYPFGAADSYTNETKALAEKAGYEAALTCEQGYLEDSTDLFSVKRMGLSADMPFWKFKLILAGFFF
jgi:peptidoglycan/xylan/chitin deacetylase (PgdA/CDA1 family)